MLKSCDCVRLDSVFVHLAVSHPGARRTAKVVSISTVVQLLLGGGVCEIHATTCPPPAPATQSQTHIPNHLLYLTLTHQASISPALYQPRAVNQTTKDSPYALKPMLELFKLTLNLAFPRETPVEVGVCGLPTPASALTNPGASPRAPVCPISFGKCKKFFFQRR